MANKTARQWYAEGDVGYGIALFSYIYGISALVSLILRLTEIGFQTAYTFVLVVLWRLTAKYSVYLIMFHLGRIVSLGTTEKISGCYDIINLVVNSFFTGYFSILGASYCTHPNMNYLVGCVGLGR